METATPRNYRGKKKTEWMSLWRALVEAFALADAPARRTHMHGWPTMWRLMACEKELLATTLGMAKGHGEEGRGVRER